MQAKIIRCGLHVSITGAIDKAVDRAKEKTCDTFQIFTRNPRGWKSKRLDSDEVIKFRQKLHSYAIEPVFAHMPYLANLASPKGNIYDKSVKTLREECDRCNELGIPYLVTHLGSHLGQGKRAGLDRLIDAINTALDISISKTTILLENAAGTMNSIGSSFSDMQEIIDHIGKPHLGICFDTCHAFAAGYDLRDIKSVNNTIEDIKDSVKLESLMLMHANDSKGKLTSRIDRHEHIGMGQIGIEGFKAILHNEIFRKLPIILETPIDKFGADIMNLNRIRQLA